MKTDYMANVLEVINESYEFNAYSVSMTYCIVMDRSTGKYYITGEEGLIKYERGFYFEAMECECDRAGRCSKLINPIKTVYIAPIIIYGRRLGYVYGKKMIDYQG